MGWPQEDAVTAATSPDQLDSPSRVFVPRKDLRRFMCLRRTLLGHETAGTVESVGEGVDSVEQGDFVILNWRAVCGQLGQLLQGHQAQR